MAGANIKPCLCMANADDDDVVMHDADCTYLDDSLLETAFIEDEDSDTADVLDLRKVIASGPVLDVSDDSDPVSAPHDDHPAEAERTVVVSADKILTVHCINSTLWEAQLDAYMVEMQETNAKLRQRFIEVEEDKRQAQRRDKEWRRKAARTVPPSPLAPPKLYLGPSRVDDSVLLHSPPQSYPAVTWRKKKKPRKNRRETRRTVRVY
ncbi:uncharacterized protein LOC134468643 [Engraulis encrasicolus]|uniref:uncharacterized protein LOC134468643 n=1 Tax=Engraulis encrasicolus TaxID=184585 RepID=UPI002FD64723